MTYLRKLLIMMTFTLFVAACGGTDEATNELAFQEDDVAELDIVDESDLDQSDTVEQLEVAGEPDPDTPASAPTTELTSDRPNNVAPVPVTSTAPETSTTTTSTTTTAAPATTAPPATVLQTGTTVPAPVIETCEADRYSIAIPNGWYDRDCSKFSPAPFPTPGAEEGREWRSEISAEFTFETPTELISRLDALHYLDVVDVNETTANGIPAFRFTIESVIFDGIEEEQDAIAVDAGDGTFFISATSFPDSNANNRDTTLEERYADSIAAMELILITMAIEQGTPPEHPRQPATSLTFNPINCATGQFAFSARNDAAETGFSVESVVLRRPNQADESLPVNSDGNYEVPGWDGPQDVSALIVYSDSAGTFVQEIGDRSCADLLGGDYQICTDDDVAIAYPPRPR